MTGSWIRYEFPEDHTQERHPHIILYLRGSFVRMREDFDDPSERFEYVAGETNDKVVTRKAGAIYRLEAREDNTIHYCVTAMNRTRATHVRVALQPGAAHAIEKDEIAVVVSGMVCVGDTVHETYTIIHAATGNAELRAGPDGASLEVFTQAGVKDASRSPH